MPVGEVLVAHIVESNGMHRIVDVEENAVAGARAGGETHLGIDGDVVALIRL